MPDDDSERTIRLETRIDELHTELKQTLDRDDDVEKLEAQLSALGERTASLEGSLSHLTTPFWKRKTFLGGGAAILLMAAGWLYQAAKDEPGLSQFVHQRLLRTDTAIAGVLKQDSHSDATERSTLFKGLSGLVTRNVETDPDTGKLISNAIRTHVQTDEGTTKHLENFVRSTQSHAYHGSKKFVANSIQTVSFACHVARDRMLRVMFAERFGEDEVISWCPQRIPATGRSADDTDDHGDETLAIPFIDTVPLVIPFNAKEGDDVVVTAKILAEERVELLEGEEETRDGDIHPKPHLTLVVSLDQETLEQQLEPIKPNSMISRASLPILGKDEEIHLLILQLSEDGLRRVGVLGDAGDSQGAKQYTITVSVVVTVYSDDNVEG